MYLLSQRRRRAKGQAGCADYFLEVPLNQAIGEAHRRYTRRINFREGWRGHLWQGRFSSFIMDEMYLLACMRYVELNPVRAAFRN